VLAALLADHVPKPVIQMLSRLAATGRRADRFLRSCICSILLFPGILNAQEDEEGSAPYQDPDARNHWAYQPVERAKVPTDVPAEWSANPIDAFLWKQLEEAGLKPPSPVGRAALYRRLHYGVTGLPPSPQEVSAFVSDGSPEAYGKAVDSLLSRPQFGERWARHWLDLVRFAETNSFENDRPKPGAWRYRDWVIKALNSDMPYDQFIIEQVAGDELEPRTIDRTVATAFYRLGAWDFDPTDRILAQYDDLDGIVTTVSQVFLATTVNCARCHDHKVDPISQKDYYRMLAFFRGIKPFVKTEEPGIDWDSLTTRLDLPPNREEAEQQANDSLSELTAYEDLVIETLPEKERDSAAADPEVRKRLFEQHKEAVLSKHQKEYYELAHKTIAEMKAKKPEKPRMICVSEVGQKAPPTHVLNRGNPHAEGGEVGPGFPMVLGGGDAVIPSIPVASSGRRLALARWMASKKNPLTARVMVNRLWQHHFGRGIVESPNDFGKLGRAPTHPGLLDWLAAEFMDKGWSMKHMHRLILNSRAYRMSSQPSALARSKDPANRLFSRFNMRRLTAEEIRDSILWANGSLNKKAGGPGVFPRIPFEVLKTQSRPGWGWGFSPREEASRRSIYIFAKRSLRPPILESFDLADTDTSCPVRFSTTQPTQALNMLNSRFMNEEAQVFAALARKEGGDGPVDQVRFVLQRVFSRPVREGEVARAVTFLENLKTDEKLSRNQALTSFCLAALNFNEFLYLE
jgi:hypothetical protein